jgi:hypothetical protein
LMLAATHGDGAQNENDEQCKCEDGGFHAATVRGASNRSLIAL